MVIMYEVDGVSLRAGVMQSDAAADDVENIYVHSDMVNMDMDNNNLCTHITNYKIIRKWNAERIRRRGET